MDNNESPLKKKEESLYSPSYENSFKPHTSRGARDIVLPQSWSHEPRDNDSSSSLSFSTIFFIASILFFLVASGFLYMQMITKRSTVDGEKIGIELVVDPYVEGGQEADLYIMVNNKNSVSLLDAKATLSYERGVDANNESKTFTQEIDLGTLLPNSVKKEKATFVLYGSEKEKRTLSVRLDYTVEGSNAVFTKNIASDVVLKSPPVSITLIGRDRATIGEKEIFTITLKNNTTKNSDSILVLLNAPPSFTLTESSRKTVGRSLSWDIDNLSPGEELSFTAEGYFRGAVGENFTMSAVVGLPTVTPNAVDPVYSVSQKPIALEEPGIGLSLAVETDRGVSQVLRYGDKVTARIRYNNTSSSTLQDVVIVAYIKSTEVDAASVFVDTRGYYNSDAGSITWNPASLPSLQALAPGVRGEVTFSFTVPKNASIPSVVIDLDARGDNVVTRSLSRTASTVTLKLQGGASISGQTFYATTLSPNTGPLPPQANKDTTFTVKLSASSQADATRAKAVFTLPAYVEWVGETSASSSVSYNSRSREVVWSIGDMKSDVVQSLEAKLRVRPSLTHVGTAPAITSGILFQATDISSQLQIEDVVPQLTTAISDASANEKSGIVVR